MILPGPKKSNTNKPPRGIKNERIAMKFGRLVTRLKENAVSIDGVAKKKCFWNTYCAFANTGEQHPRKAPSRGESLQSPVDVWIRAGEGR